MDEQYLAKEKSKHSNFGNLWIERSKVMLYYKQLSLNSAHEKEKKDLYEERILQTSVREWSFVPLVLKTSGGMGPLCTVFKDLIS